MVEPITPEEASEYSGLREVTAGKIYRDGIRHHVPATAPSNPREILIAHTARKLAEYLSDAALAALGKHRLVRLATLLVEEQNMIEIDTLTYSDDTSMPLLADFILREHGDRSIRRYADSLFAGHSEEDNGPLSKLLGKQPFVKSNEMDNDTVIQSVESISFATDRPPLRRPSDHTVTITNAANS